MKKLSLIHLFFIITSWAWAQEVMVLRDKNQLLDITTTIYFFEDKQGELSIEKVTHADFKDKFQKTNQAVPNFGVVPYPIWCKFTIQNLSEKKCFLSIKNTTLDTVLLFAPSASGYFLAKQAGNYLPSNQRDLNTNILVFELPQLTSSPQTYYMRFLSKDNTSLPIKIGTKDATWYAIAKAYWLDALYLGILLFIISYHFFIYLSLRDVSYLYYIFYGFGLLLNACYNWGYLAMLNPHLNHFAIKYSYFTVGLPSIAAVLFTMSFLQTASKLRYMHFILKIFLGILITYFVIDFFQLISPHILKDVFNSTALPLIFCLLYVAIQRQKDFLPARFYLLAWGTFLFFATWHIFVYLNLLSPPFFVNYQLQIGSALEMLFLSFALAARIKLSEKEKTDAQVRLLDSLKESEIIIKNQQSALEDSVKVRTAELEEKQKEILAQNKALVQQKEELSQQQQLIEERNKELTFLNNKMQTNELVLKKAYQKIVVAQNTIADKNEELKKYSENLALQIQERTQQITEANAELIKQNNQLEQFAFITAHNLRAPVARLLGLGSILDTQNIHNPDNIFVIEKMIYVSNELDTVIKDLNIILEIKKGINELISNVKLSDKLAKVLGLLQNQIVESRAIITSDFSAVDVIQSVSPYIESIIYNLVSNAIKYRSYKRTPLIHLQTEIVKDGFLLTISDNGLGINLQDNKGKIFGLYHRFHDHIEGKGLGLYLIKTQIEALGGSISIESTQGVGTTFSLFFKKY